MRRLQPPQPNSCPCSSTTSFTNAPERNFKVYVSDQDIVNAFAAPGGHIVLFKPIIEQADSAEEVAGVLRRAEARG